MDYDKEKVDEMVLALLYLTSSHDKFGTRAWRGLDLGVIDRLVQKGYVEEPKRNSPSLELTEAGAKLSEDLFLRFFGAKD
jgi:uncharacterized protein DUF6429